MVQEYNDALPASVNDSLINDKFCIIYHNKGDNFWQVSANVYDTYQEAFNAIIFVSNLGGFKIFKLELPSLGLPEGVKNYG